MRRYSGVQFSFGACLAAALAIAATPPAAAQNVVTVLDKDDGLGTVTNPTSLALHPDGRLFVAQRNGIIQVITFEFGTVRLVSSQIISALAGRLVTGITFSPGNDLFVSHSDGRENDPAIVISSGQITRFLASSGYSVSLPVASGLARSKSNHAPNGMSFGPDGALYIAVGGFTNAGRPSEHFLHQDEVAVGNMQSAAIQRVDINTGAVSNFATGFRNPYDLVWHSNGRLYATDNGANDGMGVTSASCTADGGNPGHKPSELNLVVPGGYYGHPNRARNECVFDVGIAPISASQPLVGSVNGIAESRAPGFAGNLFAANFTTGQIHRIQLVANGTGASISTFAVLANPLDLAIAPDGRIFVAEFSSGATQSGAIKVIYPLGLSNSLAMEGFSATGDFDGDRRADISNLHPSNGSFFVHRNLGSTFEPLGAHSSVGQASAPPSAWQTLVADFTGDGRADFADRSRVSGEFWVHQNFGNGTFDLPGGADWSSNNASRATPDWEALTGDVNGDGRADVIEHNRVTGQLRVLRNGGPGVGTFTFAGVHTNFRTKVGPNWRVMVADFNRDGFADIADFSQGGPHFFIHLNVGNFQFNENVFAVAPCAGLPFVCIAGDYNGDGFADMANLQTDTGELFFHVNLGNGQFTAPGNHQGAGLYARGFIVNGLPIMIRP